MQALKLIMLLISAGQQSMALAKSLTEAKKNAEEQGRDLTEAELRPFQQQAKSLLTQLDQTIASMKDDE